MTTAFDRPLTTEERDLLANLATRTLAEQTGGTFEEARDALADRAAEGQVEMNGDAEDVRLYVCRNLLVEAKRDWVAFHAAHPSWADDQHI